MLSCFSKDLTLIAATIKRVLVTLLLYHAVNTNTIRAFFTRHKHSNRRIESAKSPHVPRNVFRSGLTTFYVFWDRTCADCAHKPTELVTMVPTTPTIQ